MAAHAAFPVQKMSEYTTNYLSAGGKAVFSSYYRADGTTARFDRSLLDHVVFARHNLVSDGAFNEFNVIICRNVLIYFGRPLQQKVERLFDDSLGRLGVLALGPKEALHSDRYEHLDVVHSLYRRLD